MVDFSRLIVAGGRNSVGELPVLSQSLGLSTEICRGESLPDNIDEHCLVAIPFQNMRLDKYTVPACLIHIMQHASVFLYQVDEQLVDSEFAIRFGIRGLIYADRPLDQMVRAINLLMKRQLYFDRALLSKLVENMLLSQKEIVVDSCEAFVNGCLTRQELRIIDLVSVGARNREIAEQLNISNNTVKTHMSAIFRKTGARNRVELLRWAQNGEPPHKAVS
ncbi:response regulator transcription factor [Shewanella avicenniae]|uniref:Response regulator transcription factor n=1 Tax=Shewanella avicenniae TaxID=2814294 RepID=A0ABX7QPW4_9GAMM|nr:response regulator transcription factor [Shewanella avicenniae]QSX33444.1 response regulator transcription factor [Shewanella avicenniae]